MAATAERILAGKVAVVAGATRGAGRAIAACLGEAGATVYCTGRSARGQPAMAGRPETIEETAEMVAVRGGHGIALRVDHTEPEQVKALFERIQQEQDGRLDLLVNDVWGGDELTQWWVPFWEHSLDDGLRMQVRAIHSHIITAYYAAPLMVARKQGLIIEVTGGDTLDYRGNLYYDLAKVSTIRLGLAMAEELKPYNVTALALTPGFLRSEAVLDSLGVTEANWRDGIAKDPHFAGSETPYFIGRAVVALATDPNIAQKAGKTLATWHLAKEYGFNDVDGRRPDWPTFFAEMQAKGE
jgi:NAD(P)-dependent dehydrogenase (short-subunit alcohol dehydrogenase family)